MKLYRIQTTQPPEGLWVVSWHGTLKEGGERFRQAVALMEKNGRASIVFLDWVVFETSKAGLLAFLPYAEADRTVLEGVVRLENIKTHRTKGR